MPAGLFLEVTDLFESIFQGFVYLRGHGLEGTDLVKAAMEASRTFFHQEGHFGTKSHL